MLAEWAAIAIDNARLYEDVARRRAELERAVRGLEATLGDRARGRRRDRPRPRARADRQARPRAGRGPLVPGAARRTATSCAWPPAPARSARRWSGPQLPVEGSLAGTVAATGAVGARRATRGSRVGHGSSRSPADASVGAGRPAGLPRPRAAGCWSPSTAIDGGAAFDAEDEHLLASFAASAAIAIATAQSVEAERLRHRMRASEAERAALGARAARRDAAGARRPQGVARRPRGRRGRPERVQRRDRARAGADRARDPRLQSLITELRPAALDELGRAARRSRRWSSGRPRASGLDVDADVRPRRSRRAARPPA